MAPWGPDEPGARPARSLFSGTLFLASLAASCGPAADTAPDPTDADTDTDADADSDADTDADADADADSDADADPVECAVPYFESAIVTVTSSSGAPVTQAEVTLTVPWEPDSPLPCSPTGTNQWACGQDDTGALHIDVTAVGFEPWGQDIEVGATADCGYAITEYVSAELTPVP